MSQDYNLSDRAKAAVLFDVDGTLVDSNYLHTLAWARAFREVGENPPMSTIHRHIGMGSDQLIEAVIGREDETLSDRHSGHFRVLRSEIRGFAGSGDLLRAVKKLGLLVALATSAKEDDMPVLLREIGADDAIDEVVTSKEASASKPAPDIFKVALEKVGTDAGSTLVVGDSVWDVEAAKRSGLRCITVCTGGISRAELEKAGAVAVYDDPGDLLRNLFESPIAELARLHH